MAVTKYTVGSTYTQIAADISAVLGVQVDGESDQDQFAAEMIPGSATPAATVAGILVRHKETLLADTLTGLLGSTGKLYARSKSNALTIRVAE